MTEKYYFSEASLTALAQAVRNAGGTESPMTMAEIKSAIGALPVLPQNWDRGSFTPAEDSEMEDVQIPHSLGAEPTLILVFTEDGSFWEAQSGERFWRCVSRVSLTGDIVYSTGLYQSDSNVRARSVNDMGADAETFGVPYFSGYKYKGGVEYKWIAIAGE